MAETARITIGDKTIELPVTVGTEDERGFDIKRLRNETGAVTIDNGFNSTASCSSAITFLDGERGLLRYRGYPIEQLAEKSNFIETSLLLIDGELPKACALEEFNELLSNGSLLHEDIVRLIDAFPAGAHPMAVANAMVSALSSVYNASFSNPAEFKVLVARLMAGFAAITAGIYRRRNGLPRAFPKRGLSYCANFMRMMFARPSEAYDVPPEVEAALDLLLVLHADHEQNCSTSTVRLVGSSQADLFASIAAGIGALSGPLHGGANQAVIEMLQQIQDDGADFEKYVALAKDKDSNFRLMGFGHRVYKNFDPRAKIIKVACEKVLERLGIKDPLLEIARNLERVALEDPYFVKRKLYPNVDFYSGIIYRALGIPTEMFTVMFALGRLPGWIAQWKELLEDPENRIGRPRQIYIGATERNYVNLAQRA
jgi:citrate synthase